MDNNKHDDEDKEQRLRALVLQFTHDLRPLGLSLREVVVTNSDNSSTTTPATDAYPPNTPMQTAQPNIIIYDGSTPATSSVNPGQRQSLPVMHPPAIPQYHHPHHPHHPYPIPPYPYFPQPPASPPAFYPLHHQFATPQHTPQPQSARVITPQQTHQPNHVANGAGSSAAAAATATSAAIAAAAQPTSPRPAKRATVSLPCSRCGATFNQRSNLNKHIRTVHLNERPFACKEQNCDARFGHKNLLVEHERTAHRGERPYACAECGVTFGRRSNKYQHEQLVHCKRRNFACTICGMTFGLKGNLTKHVRLVHEKQRPFACDRCDAAFGLKSDLKRHKNAVHSEPPPVSTPPRNGQNRNEPRTKH